MSHWTIGKRITVGVLAVLVQALAVGCIALWITVATTRKVDVVSSSYMPVADLAGQIEREVPNARINFIYFATIQKKGSLEKGWERFRNAQKVLPELKKLVNQSDVFVAVRPQVEQLARDFDAYKAAGERTIDLVQRNQNHSREFDASLSEWAGLGDAMVDSARRLSQMSNQGTNQSVKGAAAQLHSAMALIGAGCLAALLTGLILTFFITRGVSARLTEVIQVLSDVAHQVGAAATEVSGSAQSLAQGASEQAASLEETSASSKEINAMAGQNAGNSKSAAGTMEEVSEQVNEANRDLQQMIGSMTEINDSSGKIAKIIKVIDEIAFQTNILALNAAVEAARAGEAGMGFAVVADEVRNLAQRCSQAAKDTEQLIDESITRSNDGKTKLDQVTNAVRSITTSAAAVKTLVDQVELGSQEQARGINQVSAAILEMERVTQATAAQAEESAAAGQELTSQSQALKEIVSRLNQLVVGSVGLE